MKKDLGSNHVFMICIGISFHSISLFNQEKRITKMWIAVWFFSMGCATGCF